MRSIKTAIPGKLILLSAVFLVLAQSGCNDQTGPTELWRSFIGAGFAPVEVQGNRLYAVGRLSDGKQETDVIVCLNKRTGKRLWSFHYQPEEGKTFLLPGNAPVFHNGNLYYLASDGRLLCLDGGSGSLEWDADLVGLGAEVRTGGFRGRPVFWGDRIIVNAFSAGAAFDAENGRPLWTSAKGRGGTVSPVLFEYGGEPYLAVAGDEIFHIVHPEDGRVVALIRLGDTGRIEPLIIGEGLFYLENILLQFDGDQIRLLKRYEHLDSDFSRPVLYGGLVYGFLGSPRDRRNCRFSCFDPLTGETHWTEPMGCYGTVVLMDDMLYVLNENGYLFTVQPDPAAYDASFLIQVFHEHWGAWSPPVADNGILYLRDNLGDVTALRF